MDRRRGGGIRVDLSADDLATAAAQRGQRDALVIAAVGTFLSLAAFTAPLSTLTPIATGLRSGPAGQTWLLSSMSLGLAVALLTAGALGDDLGRRKIFLLGSLLLTVSSVGCAIAPTTVVFVLARIAQGLGAAALVACSLGIIAAAVPAGPARQRATGIWGASVGAGIAVGPLLAAGLEPTLGWRAVYWLLTVLSVALAVAARTRLAESRAAHPRPVDLLGMGLLTVALAALLAGLVEGRDGWTRPVTYILLAIAGAAGAAFVLAERGNAAPMLDLTLFTRPDFVAVTVSALVAGLSVIALMSFIPTVILRGLDGTALQASLVLLGWSVTSIATALLARRLPPSFTGGHQLAAGTLVVAIGELMLTRLHTGQTLWWLVPGMVVAGAGSGIVNAALGRQAVASVPAERAGMGSGANNTARYVGSAVGVTLVVVVVSARATAVTGAGLLPGWNLAALLGAVVSALGAAVILACRP